MKIVKFVRKNSTLVLFITLIFMVGIHIFKSESQKSKLKSQIPFLSKGEKISYFELIDESGKHFSKCSTIDLDDKPSVIFIFKHPCSPCNKDIFFWNKLFSGHKAEAGFYGIVLGDQMEISEFSETGDTKFRIYRPVDRSEFINAFRIRINLPQTIVYENSRVVYLKAGNLTAEDYFLVKNFIQRRKI